MTEAKSAKYQMVYEAARDGKAMLLHSLLTEKQDEDCLTYLEHWTEEEEQICTPLIIASRNGHEKVVKLLVAKFKNPIEQEGTVKFDDNIVKGAAPLWCAASAGHIAIVEMLVNFGADINHSTKNNSTPLRAACFDRRLDIVRYLVKNNADVNIPNIYNNTCLMNMCYKGHLEIVCYLIEKGAELDAKSTDGFTALHYAAIKGHLEIMKMLFKSGAKITKNDKGLCPLMSAAERIHADIVEYCVAQPWWSRGDKISALELLGAMYANNRENYNLGRCFYYLELAMRERYREGMEVLPKTFNRPISAYENRLECQTMEELRAIRHDENALHMESLIILERILGPTNIYMLFFLLLRGTLFSDVGRLDRCIQLWRHSLNLRLENKMPVSRELLRFAQKFCELLYVGVAPPFEEVEYVFKILVENIEGNSLVLESCSSSEQLESKRDVKVELESNIHTVLYFLVIITKLLKEATSEQERNVKQYIYKLHCMGIVTRDGSSLLHLALNEETPADFINIKLISNFPCEAIIQLLIQCGANVNSTDANRNTPLHIIASQPMTDHPTANAIITSLIAAGAHTDPVNNNGDTPLDIAQTLPKSILKTQSKLTLKCLSAKAVLKFNIKVSKKLVPDSLLSFIEVHGIPPKVKLETG